LNRDISYHRVVIRAISGDTYGRELILARKMQRSSCMPAGDQANPLKMPINCPLCGRQTRFSHVQEVPRSPRDSGWTPLFFRCEQHGWIVFPAEGGVRVLRPNTLNQLR
jgi:hypothetical protein